MFFFLIECLLLASEIRIVVHQTNSTGRCFALASLLIIICSGRWVEGWGSCSAFVTLPAPSDKGTLGNGPWPYFFNPLTINDHLQ